MKGTRSILTLLLGLSLALPALAAGYLKFDGIKGESKDAAHKGGVEVLSVNQAAVPGDAASGRATGKRQHKPITITKQIDKSTPLLASALKSGTPLTNVIVEIDGNVTEMKNAMVTSIEHDGAGNEVVTLTPADTPDQPLPAALGVPSAKKGNVESGWKVEEGTK